MNDPLNVFKNLPNVNDETFYENNKLFGGLYHIETSPLICTTNQWAGFYMRDLRRERINFFVESSIINV